MPPSLGWSGAAKGWMSSVRNAGRLEAHSHAFGRNPVQLPDDSVVLVSTSSL